MIDLRGIPETKRADFRVVTTFFEAADFVICCFFVFCFFCVAAPADGTAMAVKRAITPAVLRAKRSICLTIVVNKKSEKECTSSYYYWSNDCNSIVCTGELCLYEGVIVR